MRAKSVAMLMLSLGCGLVAMIGITQVMAKRNGEPTPTVDTLPIFIAVKDVPFGERLSAEVLKLEAWPKDKVPQGALSKIEDIDGCRTRTKLFAGEPILDKKLFGKGTSMQGDSALIPKGYRVVSVKVDNVSGGPGLIMPGDRVDVLVHLLRNASQDIQETTTRTILQNIKVFAVNDQVDMEQQKESKDKDKLNAKTISLLVTPSQGATLTLASEMGKVRLVMRSQEDDTTSVDGISKPSDLLGGAKIADRENEKLYKPDEQLVPPAPPAPLAPPKKSGLTVFLENMKTQLANKAKTAVPQMSAETWTMKILHPRGVNEIVLEADSGPHAEKMPNSWHMMNTSMPGASPYDISAKKKSSSSTQPAKSASKSPTLGPPPKANAAVPDAEPQTNPDSQESKPSEKEPVADPLTTPAEMESSGVKAS